MKVFFSDCHQSLGHKAFSMFISMYHIGNRPGDRFDRYSTKFEDRKCLIIINNIKENFVSFKSWDKEEICSSPFYFTDPADEAAFLLWSSDGIEI